MNGAVFVKIVEWFVVKVNRHSPALFWLKLSLKHAKGYTMRKFQGCFWVIDDRQTLPKICKNRQKGKDAFDNHSYRKTVISYQAPKSRFLLYFYCVFNWQAAKVLLSFLMFGAAAQGWEAGGPGRSSAAILKRGGGLLTSGL